jgi:hypothetical protein
MKKDKRYPKMISVKKIFRYSSILLFENVATVLLYYIYWYMKRIFESIQEKSNQNCHGQCYDMEDEIHYSGQNILKKFKTHLNLNWEKCLPGVPKMLPEPSLSLLMLLRTQKPSWMHWLKNLKSKVNFSWFYLGNCFWLFGAISPVESRCTLLQSDAERMATCIRSEYRMQMEKLPKKVRNMTVREFFQQIGESELQVPELQALAVKYSQPAPVVAEEVPVRTPLKVVTNANGTSTVLRSTRSKPRIESNDNHRKRGAAEVEEPAPAETTRTTRRTAKTQAVLNTPAVANGKTQGIVAQTPAFCRELPFTPAHPNGAGTVLRLPRRGESIFSMRGSPVAVVNSDAAAQVSNRISNSVDGRHVGLTLSPSAADLRRPEQNCGAGCWLGQWRGVRPLPARFARRVCNPLLCSMQEVNVADPSVCAKLSKDARLKAAQNVMAMQQQLEAMLAQLRSWAYSRRRRNGRGCGVVRGMAALVSVRGFGMRTARRAVQGGCAVLVFGDWLYSQRRLSTMLSVFLAFWLEHDQEQSPNCCGAE